MVKKRFNISRSIIDSDINFNGCRTSQDMNGTIKMSMKDYMDSIDSVYVRNERRKEQEIKATVEEYDAYISLAGSIIWAGHGTLPQTSFLGSLMQQNTPNLKVKHVTEANRLVKEL